jgi:predicted aspartyl protease
LIFLVFAAFSYKKPAISFLGALIFYLAVIIVLAVIEPATLLQGIILKVLVVIALVKGYKDAKEFEQMKRTLGTGAAE